MCLCLFEDSNRLRLVVAYEDGRVAVFSHTRSPEDFKTSPIPEENSGWNKLLEYHEHKEPSESKPFRVLQQNLTYLLTLQ